MFWLESEHLKEAVSILCQHVSISDDVTYYLIRDNIGTVNVSIFFTPFLEYVRCDKCYWGQKKIE